MFRALFNGLSAAQDSEHLYLINFLLFFLDFGIFSSNKIKHLQVWGESSAYIRYSKSKSPKTQE